MFHMLKDKVRASVISGNATDTDYSAKKVGWHCNGFYDNKSYIFIEEVCSAVYLRNSVMEFSTPLCLITICVMTEL